MLTSLFIEKAKILIYRYTFLDYPFCNVHCLTEPLAREIRGAKETGQRPVGITEENGATFSDQTGPTREMALIPFFIRFPSSLHKWRETEQWTRFDKSRLKYFDRNKWTISRGDIKYSRPKEPKRIFPLDFRPKFP